MSDQEIMQKLCDSLNSVMNKSFDVASLKPETDLRKDVGIASLEVVELVFEMEDKFSIKIKDDEIPQLQTVGDVVTLVKVKLG